MNRRTVWTTGVLVLTLGWAAAASGAATDAQKCEASKDKVAGKYYFCRLKADAKAALTGLAADYSKCIPKFDDKWDTAENKVAGACPDNVGLSPAMNTYVTDQATETAAIIAGTQEIPTCGDDAINVAGEQCDGTDLGGETCASLGFDSGTLACASCAFDTSACVGGGGDFPASGQTTPYGTGSDGDIQAGATLSYTDNGDGTITDNNTGLMWEKKDDSGGIHDKDNTYTWSGASYGSTNIMDGTIATTFLATLNAGGGFAGHTDWRIPNAKELQSIVNYEVSGPSVDPAFHHAATCGGCTDVTNALCSCTASADYWSSTTYRYTPDYAWGVYFAFGYVTADSKDDDLRARAVRGGL